MLGLSTGFHRQSAHYFEFFSNTFSSYDRMSHERLQGPTAPVVSAPDYATGWRLVVSQFRAVFFKRFLQWSRSYKLLIVLCVLPMLLTVVGLAVVSTVPTVGDEPIRAFTLAPYSGSTITYSHSDAGGDFYSGATAAATAALGQAGLRAPNTLQLGLRSSLFAAVLGDNRFSTSTIVERTATNVTSAILSSATNYFVNLFYRRNIVSITTQPGAFRLQPSVVGGCALRVGNSFVDGAPLTLAAGQAYEFVLYKAAISDGIFLSTSATNQAGFALASTSSSTSNLTRVDSGMLSAVRWTVPSALVGSSVFCFCGPFDTAGGLPLSVVADPTLSSVSTGDWF
jgi:hypothetical protein